MKIRRPRPVAALGAVALILATLTGCSSATGYDTLCVDPVSQIRVDDAVCTVQHTSWIYYVPYGYAAPAYGVHVHNYTTNNYQRPKSGAVHTGGVPASGGKASAPPKPPKVSTSKAPAKPGGTAKPQAPSKPKAPAKAPAKSGGHK